MEAIHFTETSVLIRATRRRVPEDGIVHSHRRENLKSEDRNRWSLPNVACSASSNIARVTEARVPANLSVMHHRQNVLKWSACIVKGESSCQQLSPNRAWLHGRTYELRGCDNRARTLRPLPYRSESNVLWDCASVLGREPLVSAWQCACPFSILTPYLSSEKLSWEMWVWKAYYQASISSWSKPNTSRLHLSRCFR
jgi:hypothetical protein